MERQRFADAFYDISEDLLDRDVDCMAAYPWGAPWYWCVHINVDGTTIEQWAKSYYDQVCNDIKDGLAEKAQSVITNIVKAVTFTGNRFVITV